MWLLLKSIGISSLLYAGYVQFNPKLGNIWLRPDDTGKKMFVPSNLINLMKEPINNSFFWETRNLDLNIFVWNGVGYIIVNSMSGLLV